MTLLKHLFSEGFRIFFLAAVLFAALMMVIWEGWLGLHALGADVDMPIRPAPHLWHAHEMIFGYGAAALAGFLLTAVPNWTGAKAAPHRFIALAALVWAAGRLTLWFSGSLPPLAVAVADLAFLPLLGLKILALLIKRPKPQQMIFLAMLLLFWTANLMVHLEWLGLTSSLWAGLRMGLLTLCALIMVLGGRVTPGFTRNAMVQSGKQDGLPWNPMPLAALSIVAALTQPLGYMAGAPDGLMGATALLAGALGLLRVALWRGLWAWNKPILWSLHLSYALNGLGLLALGLADMGIGSEVAALHLLGVGAVGGMTVAIMSRASLGHTGRALVAPGPVALAYALIPLAALARFTGSALPEYYTPAVLAAGGLWIVAFTLCLACLTPVLLGPRVPRAPVGKPAR